MCKRRRMRPGSLLLASAAALSLGACGGSSPPPSDLVGGRAAGAAVDVDAGRDEPGRAAGEEDGGGIVTLPLLSHRHLVERRGRELGEDEEGRAYDRIPRRYTRGAGASGADGGGDGGRGLAIQQIGALYQGYGTHYSEFR